MRCHQLAAETRAQINTLTGLEPISPDSPTWFVQMSAACLPSVDVETLQQRLYEAFRIEVKLLRWNEQPFIRVSFQAYNDQLDADTLLSALRETLS
jgi:selenocysteine lyase/cysteine desulfurase